MSINPNLFVEHGYIINISKSVWTHISIFIIQPFLRTDIHALTEVPKNNLQYACLQHEFLGEIQLKKSLRKWIFSQKNVVLFEKNPKNGLLKRNEVVIKSSTYKFGLIVLLISELKFLNHYNMLLTFDLRWALM